MSEARAQGRAGAAMLAGAWLALALPMFLGATLWFRDLLIYTYPQKSYVLERLLRGELPVWCERWGTGRPFFGLVQPGALDPLNALLLLPHPLSLDLYNLSHLLVMMFGARAWLRREGVDEVDAAASGALLGMSGYVASMLSCNGTYAWGVAFVPWCLVAVAAAGEKPDLREALPQVVGVAAAVSLGVLSGDPMSALFAGGCGLAVALSRGTAGARRRSLFALAGGCALAGMLCAIQLLPAVEVARTYRGGGVTQRDAETFSLHPRRLLELLVPDALGQPFSRAWEAPSLYTRSAQQRLIPFALTVHQGVATLPLALLALSRRRRLDLALGALLLAGLALAFGRHAPVWPWMFAHVPGVAMFRHPEKYTFLSSLALAALAARGLAEARRVPVKTAAAAGLMGLAMLAASRALPASGALRGAAWLGGYAAAFALVAWKRSPRALVALLPAAMLACELTLGVMPLYRWTPAAPTYAPPPLLQALSRDRPGGARGALVFRDLLLRVRSDEMDPMSAVASLMPNLAMRDGVRFLDSYDAIRVSRVRSLRREVRRAPVALLRAWGADYAVLALGGALPAGLAEVAADPARGVRLVRVAGPAPRVYLARRSVPVRGPDEALRAMEGAGFTPGESAAVEGEAREARGRCVVVREAPEAREFQCESDAPGWLHVGETFDPAWRARVNGREVAAARSNELFVAIPVPAGASRVQMSLRAKGLRAGAGISLAGVALALALSAAPRGRWRRARERRSLRRTRGDETGS